jgi:hypothetical protein
MTPSFCAGPIRGYGEIMVGPKGLSCVGQHTKASCDTRCSLQFLPSVDPVVNIWIEIRNMNPLGLGQWLPQYLVFGAIDGGVKAATALELARRKQTVVRPALA